MTPQTPPTDRPLTAGDVPLLREGDVIQCRDRGQTKTHEVRSISSALGGIYVDGGGMYAPYLCTFVSRPATPAASEVEGHYGDPCLKCGIGHDDVPIGPCRADGITISRDRANALLDYLKKGSGPAGWPTTLWVEVQHFIKNVEAALASPPVSELLREARWYVKDHQESQPNDETKDLLARIDGALK